MATPFLSQIDIFSFNFAPKGYAMCNGQLLPINQNQALFSLLGTTYGGDGRVNFGLPDLRSRTPVGAGNQYVLGQRGGSEAVTITQVSMPSHTHQFQGNNAAGTANGPSANAVLSQAVGSSNTGQPFGVSLYGSQQPSGAMFSGTLGNTGGSQSHNNLMPYLVLNMCIALQGIFPSQN
jgi:microcystin-dependent protein